MEKPENPLRLGLSLFFVVPDRLISAACSRDFLGARIGFVSRMEKA